MMEAKAYYVHDTTSHRWAEAVMDVPCQCPSARTEICRPLAVCGLHVCELSKWEMENAKTQCLRSS